MKKKSFVFSIVLIMCMSIFLAACGGGEKSSQESGESTSGSGDPIVIKFSHVVDERSPKGKAANLFKELAEERLAGKVEVEVYPNSQLYNDEAALEALEAGNIQMMAPSNSIMIGLDRNFEIFLMPYLFNSAEAVIEFSTSETGQKLYSGLEKYNMKVLSTWTGGDMVLSNSKREIKKPSDLEGLKFRVMSGGVLADHFATLGAGATVIPFSETYVALQQGTVDGQENPYNNIETQKFQEVQGFITETRHSIATYPLLVNAEFWNGLPEDIRTELNKIVEEVTAQELAWTNELNEESKKIIVDSGKTKITTLTDEERQAFIDAVKPVHEKYEEIIGKEFFDYARSLK